MSDALTFDDLEAQAASPAQSGALTFGDLEDQAQAARKASGHSMDDMIAGAKRVADAAGRGVGEVVSTVGNIPADAWNAIPGRILGMRAPTMEPGKSLAPEWATAAVKNATEALLRPKGLVGIPAPQPTPASEGLSNVAEGLAKGATTPEGLATLPFLAAKPVQAAFLAQTALSTPAAVKEAAEALGDTSTPPAKQWEALGNAGAQILMSAALALGLKPEEVAKMTPKEAVVKADEHVAKSQAEPAAAEPITFDDLEKQPEVAQPETAQQPVNPPITFDDLEGEQPAEEIPLGVLRPKVQDPALRSLSDDDFDAEFRAAAKNVDVQEKAFDEGRLTSAKREDIAAAQDRWTAADLERFRRNNIDVDPSDLFRKLLREPDAEHQKLLLGELKRQGASVNDMLAGLELRSPDQAEVFRGQLEDLKKLSSEPKLLPGEDQGDLISSTQSEDFSLAGEKMKEPEAAPAAPEGPDPNQLELGQAPMEPPATMSDLDPRAFKVAELPVADIHLSEDVPNFKAEADPQTRGDVVPPVRIQAFGGGVRAAAQATVVTPQQSAAVQTAMTPGLTAGSGIWTGLKSLVAPTTMSAAHLEAGELLGAKIGAMNRRQESSVAALKGASKYFDKLGVHDERLAPGQNPGIKFMSDVSQGRPLTGPAKPIADLVQKQFEERLAKLDLADAPLQTVRENYFPGMWTRESRQAFNLAMDEATTAGTWSKNQDVNLATPAQRAAIKARVDQLLEAGKGSDQDMLSYLTRTPMKGKEGFRKQKVFEDIMTGAEMGLRPVSNNPIDLVKGKLAEMDRSLMANEFFQSLRAGGKLKTIDPYEEVPDGWQKINDKYGTIYGPPTVKVSEHVDRAVYEGLLDAAQKIGVSHERLMRFPPGQGSRALGLSFQGGNRILSRFGTETSVIAHELGHQLDHKYDLWNRITGGEKGNERKSPTQKELRAIADETGNRGGDTRSKPEKIAQMVEMYVHAPEKMKAVAPGVFGRFDRFIKSTPELKGIADIRPNIELRELTSDKYVGLPIVGYRIVPDAVGDVVNNYLSSSLYNNRYFGGLYKAWMGAANALNQSQLGLGSAFHAGFTTNEAQIAAGAGMIKELYGVARGNRTVGDLARSAGNWTVSTIRTPVTGDRVLNAWRNPDGVMTPKLRDVARAAELAGGGFRMERGMQTEQGTQMVRDWYSGHPFKAALRSPIALTEAMAKPILSYLVPRQKAGVFAELASRIIEQNPGKPIEDLTPQFRQAWNRVDARLGQVRYDRLFANNTAKNLVQGLVRAPGWSGGTIAELGGAFPDALNFLKEWAQTGKAPQDIPDRVAYTMSLLATMATINGALSYGFTGQMPTGMDFLAFRNGQKDSNGNDQRWLLPSYLKDLIAYWRQPGSTLLNKSHPLINMISDVARNRDYYGYEIRDPHADPTVQGAQTAQYVVKAFTPFWIRGEQQMKADAGAPQRVAPLVGIMPAPGYVDRSPMQNRITQLYRDRTGNPLKPLATRAADEAKRAGRDYSDLDRYMFGRLPASDKAALARDMSPEEHARYGQ